MSDTITKLIFFEPSSFRNPRIFRVVQRGHWGVPEMTFVKQRY